VKRNTKITWLVSTRWITGLVKLLKSLLNTVR
jgi:hypothetical protein